jgi:predicted DNA-binding transcriptional regulator AlpA
MLRCRNTTIRVADAQHEGYHRDVSLNLVAIPEIAQMLGVSRQRASRIIHTHGDFPKPEVELSIGKVWLRSTVENWVQQRGRPPGPRGTSA